jgi:hypothetical protein
MDCNSIPHTQKKSASNMRQLSFLPVVLCLLALIFAACDTKPVVLVATPIPPDATFRTYRHPTGVFSIRLPADWAVRDVSQGGVVRVEFSPPGATGLPMTVYVLNTGTVLTASALLDTIEKYQRIMNGDEAQYHEISRTAQGDGSWRLVGVRQTPIGPRQLNTFLQADGAFLTAVEVDLTGYSDAQLQAARAVINTLRVDSAAVIASGDIRPPADSANSSAAAGVLAFSGLYTWTNPSGDFIINGQVTNQSGGPLEAIVITAVLFDAQDTSLVEQQSVAPVEVLYDRATAPFSIRFRGGKPSQTVRYELQAAARNAEYTQQTYMGDDKFIKGNDKATYNAAGFLTVSGDVVNQTQNAAYFVKVIVTVLDDQGRVVATDSVFLNKSPLLPGDVARFDVTFPELGGSAIRYLIALEGRSQQGQ